MGSIQTGIEMQDQFSSTLLDFTNRMMEAVGAAASFSAVIGQDVDTSGLSSVRDEIQSVMDDMSALNQAAEIPISPTVSAEVRQIEAPSSLEVPVTPVVTEQPQIDLPEMEVQSVRQFNEQMEQAQASLQRVSAIQQEISTQSQGIDIFPDDLQMEVQEDAQKKIQEINNSILEMQAAMDMISQNPFDMPTETMELQLASLKSRITETLQEQLELSETLSNMDIEIEQPPPVQIPVEWQTDNLDVFTSTGIDRFRQEAQSANQMLEQLGNTQNVIASQAAATDILPQSAVQDMNRLAARIDSIRERMQQIENNPLNMGTERTNNQLEQLRSRLSQAVTQQDELNSAIDRMDVQSANSAYLQLSRTIGSTEAYIRDNVNEQEAFNNTINEGTENANGLMKAIKGAVAAYVTVNSIKDVLNASDELMQTTSRLDMMNDNVQTTQDLVNMVYIAAQDARGSFNDMADVVARFGNNAKDAFSSSAEVVQFAGLVQKQMTIAGASTQEASNAMLQLSQALGSGVLRGDELNSIFEQAPNLIQNIAGYIEQNDELLTSVAKGLGIESEALKGDVMGHIRDIAAEGMLSADIVKASVFAATDDINAKFDSMPITWNQVWTSMQNTATMAFQPVLQKLSDIANSEQFQEFMANAVYAMAFVAGAVLRVFDLMGAAGQFAAEHWDVLSPIIYTVVGALTAYALYLGITNTIQAISTAIKIAAAVASYAHAAATGTEASATAAATAAQYGLNTALLSCPLTWIILAIIALIAVVIAVASHIAKMGGTATTAFGVICGWLNYCKELWKNVGLTIANFVLGVGNAINALGSNIVTAFSNAIAQSKANFYALLSVALTVISEIAEALNKLPFIEFDYSGVTSLASKYYAAKSAEAANNIQGYQSISEAFNEGNSTFDTFQEGWAVDAYKAGAAWGDGISNKVSDMFNGLTDNIPQPEDYLNYNSGNSAEIAQNTGDTAKAAQKAAQSLDISGENLKYIKDMAERDYINRFTTAKISVKQTNHNTVKNNMDLDGINEYLRSDLEQRMAATAEGVH